MYNYKSGLVKPSPYAQIVSKYENPEDDQYTLLGKVKNYFWKDSEPMRINSPTISACTTATNLSSLDFQSNSTLFKKIMKENLTIAEIEPLQQKKIQEDISEDESDNETKEISEKNSNVKIKNVIPQLIAAIAVSWVSLVVGYASAYTSPAGVSLERQFNLTEDQFSWICGLMPLGALAGGFLGGPLIEYLGRKYSLLVTDILFLVAWILNYFAQNYLYMYASRTITGLTVGIASLTLPVYLGETVQPEVRGTLGLLPTAFGNVGILICFLLGMVVEWDGLAGVGALLAIPFLVLIWIIPETPRWYISKGRTEDSRKALQWLRGKKQNIDKEFQELEKSQNISNEKSYTVNDLLSKSILKPLLIVLGLMFFQQFSGINAVIFYTTKIFQLSGSQLNANLCTVIVGVVNFVSTFIATILIDKLGRKVLLYISSISMVITLAVLGAYFYIRNYDVADISSLGWLPLASFVVYVLGFSLGFGPIPWLMMGEILPSKIRGPAASLSTAFNWSCTFIVTKTFLLIIDGIGTHGTFWLFGAIMVVALVFCIMFVPETRGQSLEDIERKLAGVKVRRMSSVANLKPMPSTF